MKLFGQQQESVISHGCDDARVGEVECAVAIDPRGTGLQSVTPPANEWANL